VLDEQGFQEMGKLLVDLVAKAERVQSQSAARIKQGDGGEIPTTLALMHFESPPR
jgi:hypothetical protein